MLDYMLPDGFMIRPATLQDAEPITAMLNAAAQRLTGASETTVEETYRYWSSPNFNVARDTRLVVAPNGQFVGYDEVWDLNDPHTLVFVWGRVHPDYTRMGIGSALLRWAEERARQAILLAPAEARVVMQVSPLSIDQPAQEMLRDKVFQLVRHILRMVIELDNPPGAPIWPEGIQVRTVVAGQDEYAAFAAGREAFRDHWGFTEHPIEEEYQHWSHTVLADPQYDPSLWFLAVDGEEIAGNSMCRKYTSDDPHMGWVASLSVRRPWRKQGLGLALLLHSFAEFHRRGYRKVALGVDAQNLTGALRLYEKAGMHSDLRHTLSTYEKELRPGKNLSTVE